ncbi:hypothetical protein EHS25_010216 [Saitozyma podzolica]|uniref:MATE family multidrug resistance protein n=1 Tax=Saitozyma podzolica TaxID=1890683 RepID=A0A427YIZ5_9TREE|nr:hypothetical protein EHS25_010216 [Saitozyma podzolica]
MSNFPHSTSISSSLSTSPFAVQTNLETLINRSRLHPHPRRPSTDEHDAHPPLTHLHPHAPHPPHPPHVAHTHASPASVSARHPSEHVPSHPPRIGTIREASYDDGAAILLDADADGDQDEDESAPSRGDERSALLGGWSSRRSSGRSRRKSYGATSEPLGQKPRRNTSGDGSRSGNSRSRSKARTPPRDGRGSKSRERRSEVPVAMTSTDESATETEALLSRRGRDRYERPLSRETSPVTVKSTLSAIGHPRRMSVTTRFEEDSSGDEGGDVARGLAATGGAAIMGTRPGLGFVPTGATGQMDLDPVEELTPEELEVPTGADGLEVRQWSEALRAEVAIITRSSMPVFFTQIAEWSLVLASVVSIGHLGTTDLAASSLASMTASVSSFSILQGLATALDTLLPAAWTSSDPSRVGLWAQRTSVVMAVSTIPMFILWWNIEGVLLALQQEPAVAARASLYLRWLSFGIPGYGGNVVVKKYLQSQNLMHVPTYILFIVAPLNLVFNWLLVWGPDPIRLGFAGGALATALSYNLTFLLSLGWTFFLGPREAFHPLHARHLFSKLGTVTSLGLAGTIMLSSEWWAWEACALAASLLGPTTLAAQSVLLSTASTFFQVPASLGIASAVRCGNLLGAGRGWEAKWASRASLFLSVGFALVNSTLCIIFRKNWGYLFNSDPEVVAIVASIMPYIALFQIADGVAATAGSILRSLGLHTTGALINLTSYYIIGLPFGLWLTFQPKLDLGLIGLWIGLSVALGYASVVSFVLVWRANWVRAVERVRERLGLAAHGEVGEDGKWHDDEEAERGRRASRDV